MPHNIEVSTESIETSMRVFGHSARQRILRALLADGQGLRYRELLRTTGVSTGTLDRHLRVLRDLNVVVVNLPDDEIRRGDILVYRLDRTYYRVLLDSMIAGLSSGL